MNLLRISALLAISSLSFMVNSKENHSLPGDIDEVLIEAKNGDSFHQFLVGMYYLDANGIFKTNNPNLAVKWFNKAAEQGESSAMYKLAALYYNGRQVVKDLDKAVMWATKSAELGNADSQFLLGNMYKFGEGKPKNTEKMLSWFEKAAKNNNSGAQGELGRLYLVGEFVKKDANKGIPYLERAAKNRHVKSMYLLALVYAGATDLEIEIDHKKSSHWFKIASNFNHSSAQYYYANNLMDGVGTTKDTNKAIKLYTKSSENGNSDAQFKLGKLYKEGKLVKQDNNLSIKWYSEAAKQGNIGAQNQLGIAYYFGEGVSNNTLSAIFWIEKAANQNSHYAYFLLGYIYSSNTSDFEAIPSKAFDSYKKSADLGNVSAHFELGKIYELGAGTSKNIDMAIKYYEIAAKNGNKKADEKLKVMKG